MGGDGTERYVPSDKEVKALYHTLIGASWEDADKFESHQNAWLLVCNVWGVHYDFEKHRVTRFDPTPRTRPFPRIQAT